MDNISDWLGKNRICSGWLAPDGTWYKCGYFQHERCAMSIARHVFKWRAPHEIALGEPLPSDDIWLSDAGSELAERGYIRCAGNNFQNYFNWHAKNPKAITHAQRRELSENGFDPDNPKTSWILPKNAVIRPEPGTLFQFPLPDDGETD